MSRQRLNSSQDPALLGELPPCPLETIEAQVKLAVNEATDMELVPNFYQKYKTHNNPGGNK